MAVDSESIDLAFTNNTVCVFKIYIAHNPDGLNYDQNDRKFYSIFVKVLNSIKCFSSHARFKFS